MLVHCVGEKLEERDADKTLDGRADAARRAEPRRSTIPNRLVIAYEPVWAIGTGRNATDEQAQEVHAFIRRRSAKKWNADFADRVRIQYGGSMKPENAKGLLGQQRRRRRTDRRRGAEGRELPGDRERGRA